MSTNSDDPILCPCSGTRESRLRQRYRDGLKTLNALADATGVCTGCAGCEADIVALIQSLDAETCIEPSVHPSH